MILIFITALNLFFYPFPGKVVEDENNQYSSNPTQVKYIGVMETHLTSSSYSKKRNSQHGTQSVVFKNKKRAKQYLMYLQKKKKLLRGDFYGINRQDYRYVNIFDRLGYIGYKINRVEKEIQQVKDYLENKEK